ncbi:MAG: rhodanese-like domain-containing protein [Micrococcales bacterium]
MMTAPDYENLDHIIDVRRPFEYQVRHIEGAENISYELTDFAKEVSHLDKNGHYITYCNYGGRGGHAAELMRQLGFKHVAGHGIEDVARLTGKQIVNG